MSQLIYIPFDHLHRNFGALRQANAKEDVIAFVESADAAVKKFNTGAIPAERFR